MHTNSLKNTLEIKELELSALLEITQAINNNLSEEALYKIFHFTLRANLQIRKMALYVFETDWKCKVSFGSIVNFMQVPMDSRLLDIHDICYECTNFPESPFAEFDTVIPIKHKNNLLALVLLGGIPIKDQANTNFIEALSNIIIVAIENKRMTRRQIEQEAFRKEMEIAKNVQQLLFPKKLPNSEFCRVAALYLPHHTVGGDYYDYLAINDNIHLVCIADVSGKGIPAALLMSNFQACLRTLVRQTTDLTFVVNELNHQVMQSANGENFITFFVAIYYKKEQELHYVNAGHNHSFLVEKERGLMVLDKGSTVLGAIEPLPFMELGKVENVKDFTLFNYTDGITETFNEQEEEFGENRLIAIIKKHWMEDPTHLHATIIKELNIFKGTNDYRDDITILTMQQLGK